MTSRLDELQKFLEDEPADAFTHYAIAMEYVSLGKFPTAVEKLEDVITLDPKYVPAYHQLGLVLAKMKNRRDAMKAFEEGIRVAELVGDSHARAEMEDAIDELDGVA